jgi:type IX secretion system substrate protein
MKAAFLIIFFFPVVLQAQSNTVTAGGSAMSITGSSTFSIGQVVYHTNGNNSFSIREGIQQPFEIIPLNTDEIGISNADTKIYPNPTFSGFFIKMPTEEIIDVTYHLSDISGKIIRQGKINNIETFIAIEDLTPGTYILKIGKTSKPYHGYKIIKQ